MPLTQIDGNASCPSILYNRNCKVCGTTFTTFNKEMERCPSCGQPYDNTKSKEIYDEAYSKGYTEGYMQGRRELMQELAKIVA